MFRPLNKEIGLKKLKSFLREREDIKEVYYKFLITFDLDSVFNLQSTFEINNVILEQAKEYALFNYLQKYDIDIYKYDIKKYKTAFLLYIEKLIKKKEFLKAKKFLNLCKSKGFICNKYYELLSYIEDI